ncbi:MAG TPA: virulence protein SciE type [Chromatiaceae bacterium]|jgi:type VI secretion system protein ImpE|nr:MAG: hypothetical protein N838_02430 [Thiohalocapsa sp. PB-PSB1]QQO54726.1 MAG: virulence protein SciE type [Thiohalocapsa sp. PB-PSB1]HBG94384.1 virulence protein SciE type [Chromatiaceae bacterium]HCS90647.1 virulence protein SciE type [Chromatiaceae bacterium]
MDAELALKQGDLDVALQQLQAKIRKAPADPKLRVFLFQLFCVLGDWQKAANQLKVAVELDAGSLAMARTYKPALQAAALRDSVFAGERDPIVFGEPEQWIALLFQALRVGAQGNQTQSQQLRSQAFAAAPETPGQIDGESFAWIADADMRMGPMLEMILNGRYNWVPFQHIRHIRFEQPTDLRDLVWMPAHITWTNAGKSVALIPTRYPGSETSQDSSIRLAAHTDWLEQGEDLFYGLGQRMLATDQGEYPLLAIREIQLNPAISDTDKPDTERPDTERPAGSADDG